MGSRLDAFLLHVRNKLVWDFLKDLLGEDMGSTCWVLIKLDKLNDVSLCRMAEVVANESTVGVKLIHHLEIFHANTDDDDRER
jgi:hypothetical protein